MDNKIRVMSYNIRYPAPKDTGTRAWDHRCPLVLEIIKKYAPDILGLQEAFFSQLNDLQPHLPEYTIVAKGRDDGQKQGETTAILYRTDRFKLVKENVFWFSRSPEKPSRGFGATIRRICTHIELMDQSTNNTLIVANSHIDHRSFRARRKSAEMLVERFGNQSKPVILLGDFNCSPRSRPYKILTKRGKFTHTYKTHIEADRISKLTFNAYDPEKQFWFGQNYRAHIDWILINDSLKSLDACIITDLVQNTLPSDHYPVFADLKYNLA